MSKNYHEHSDFIYFNINISNQSGDDQPIFQLAQLTKYNEKAIVRDTTDKCLSIERLTIPTSGIPLWYAEPLDETDPNSLLKFTIGLEYNGFFVSKNLKYFPDTDYPNPIYWYGYTYSQFIFMVNETLKEVFVDLALLTSLPVNSVPPFFLFDPKSQTISLIAQKLFYDTKTLVNPIKIWVNSYLQDKFEGIEVAFFDIFNAIPNNNKLAYFAVFNKSNNDWSSNDDYYEMIGDYNVLNRWNSLRAIVIKSNLPIENEYVDVNYSKSATQTNTTSENILRDFTINYGEFSSVGRTTVDYAVQDRIYISLIPHAQIQNIYVQIYWIDQKGIPKPLYLRGSETASIKFLVKRKDMQF